MFRVLYTQSDNGTLVLSKLLDMEFETEEMAKACISHELAEIAEMATDNTTRSEIDQDKGEIVLTFDDGGITIVKFAVVQPR